MGCFVVSFLLQNKRNILRRLNENLKAQVDIKEENEPKDICEVALPDEKNQHQEENHPVPPDRKKWEAGAQLVVPLAQLTMEASFTGTEGKLTLFKFVNQIK